MMDKIFDICKYSFYFSRRKLIHSFYFSLDGFSSYIIFYVDFWFDMFCYNYLVVVTLCPEVGNYLFRGIF